MSWIGELIDRGRKILDDFSRVDADNYIRQAVSALGDEGIAKPKAGLKTRGLRVGGSGSARSWSTKFSDADYRNDVETLIIRLTRLKEEKNNRANTPQGNFVNVTASNSVTTNISINLAVFRDIHRAITDSDELTNEQKAQMKKALCEMLTAAQSNKPKTVGEKLREFLSIGADAATVWPVLGQLLFQLGQILVDQTSAI